MSFVISCGCCGAQSNIESPVYKLLEEDGDIEIHCGDHIIDTIQCNKCGNKISSR